MRATRESGKGFQTEKEGKSKLGQIFCKEQNNEKCETMRKQRVFSPGRLQGLERDKPVTCWWRGQGNREQREQVTLLTWFLLQEIPGDKS